MDSWRAEFGDAFAGQRVLVTGASGFVGGHLSNALIALGADVCVLDSQGAGCPDGCESYAIDLKDLEAVRSTLAKARPQVVYHVAALVTARQEMDLVLPMLFNNLVGTVHLFLALAKNGCPRVVTISSSEEPTDDVPTSPYAASKAGARLYAGLFQQTYGLPITVARLFMAYGPRQRPDKLIPYLVLAFLRGQSPLLSSGARVCDFVYIFDVVRGLLKIGLRPDLAGQTVELGTGKGISIRDAALLTAALTGSPAQPQLGAVEHRTGERPKVANLTATQTLLDWKPRWSLSDGLTETIAWYRDQWKEGGVGGAAS